MFSKSCPDPQPVSTFRAGLAGALLALFLIPLAGLGEDSDWPMWGYDAARSGMTPMKIPADLHLQWTRQLPAPQPAWPAQRDDRDKLEFDLSYSPVVLGDKIFVPSMNSDRLTAYRIADGSEVWRHYADGPVRLAPAAAEGKVYFVSDDGHLYCVDADSGERLWRFRAAPIDRLVLGNRRLVSMWAARGGPVIKDGTVYFAAGVWPFMGTFVFALDAETGDVVWKNTGDATNWQAQPHGGSFSFAGIAPQGYLAATKDRLVVSGGRSPAALLDRQTGELLAMDIVGKSVGGYRVRADDEFYYQHGSRFRLDDGKADGKGDLVNKALQERGEALAEELGAELYEAIAARGRVFLSLTDGRLLCYGPDPAKAPSTLTEEAEAAKASAEITGRPIRDSRVQAIVNESKVRGKNVLFLGVGDGNLLEEVAVRTGFHVIGVDHDEKKIAALRDRFDRAGLYGQGIALLPAAPDAMPIPPYIFSFIVVDEPGAIALDESTLHGLLRPYGGKAFLGQDRVVSRDGPLPGAGQWTHQYADAARTAVSRDDLVRAPLGVLWYGSESHDNILPRHAMGPRPHVAGGRLVILGVESISARDVYTGRELWTRPFPGVGHPFTDLELEGKWSEGTSVYMTNIPGSAYIGTPHVTLADSIYLRYQGRIHHLDPATGEPRGEFSLYPEGDRVDPKDYGHLSVSGDLILSTTEPQFFDDAKVGGTDSWNATSSRHLIVMNRHTGKRLWEREAKIGFRHNAIVAGDGRVFVIDGVSEQALKFLSRRGELPKEKSRVIALDANTGQELWNTESEVFGTYLAFSEAHDILMESGSRDTRRPLSDEPASKAIARLASSGKVLWEERLDFPAAIRGDILIPARPGNMRHILSGDHVPDEHPITGEVIPETYTKFYGCSAANVSTHLVMFRSGSAGFIDSEQCGTANLGGFKSGCTSNMIAADGILNAPDYTRTCTCSYQNQTSLGLIHMAEADLWTSVTVGRGKEGIRRLGINLGAPGSRRAADGTLWTPFPTEGAPAPELQVRLLASEAVPDPEALIPPKYHRRHPLEIDGTQGLNWVAASGVEGIREFILDDIGGEGHRYTVTLHFAEHLPLESGTRVFDLRVQGESVRAGFDPVREAGGPLRAVTVRVEGIEIEDSLRIELIDAPGSRLAPVLSGVELVLCDS